MTLNNTPLFQVTDHQGKRTLAMVTDTSSVGRGIFTDDSDRVQRHMLKATDLACIKAVLDERRTCAQRRSVDALNLSECDFSNPQAFQALLQLVQGDRPICPSVLDLSATKFASKTDFSKLLSALAGNTSVVELDLSNFLCSEYVTNDGSFHRFLSSNKTLQKLDLSGHCLTMEVVVELTRGLQSSSTLSELKLHSCVLTDESAALLLQHATNLQVLDLSANTFSTNFLNTSIANLLQRSSTLTSLALNHSSSMFDFVKDPENEIQPFLTALASNKTCQQLSLRYGRLSEAVGESLLRALVHNTALRSLDLEFSGFGLRDKGCEVLIQYIPQLQALTELKIITVYPIEQVPLLLQALQKNTSLQSFTPRFRHRSHFTTQCCVQSILQRNIRLAQAKSLLVVTKSNSNHDDTEVQTSAAILPLALAQLSQTKDGSAATFQVLQHFIGYCV
ncbi:hypothetical protein ACA910_008689 [Epithemia clementina (nom. ined.)]